MSDLLYALALLWVAFASAVVLILGATLLYFLWEDRKMVQHQRDWAERHQR